MRHYKRKITRKLIVRHYDLISNKALIHPTPARLKALSRLAVMFHQFVE